MSDNIFKTNSRRTTPWTGLDNATPLQVFIDSIVSKSYEHKHTKVTDSKDEIVFLNSYRPNACPHCGSESFIRYGKTSTGTYKYKCKVCERMFSITTGTIFQNHKIPITEWIEFCLCLFRFQSFNSISKTNRNSYTTTKYWLSKICLLLKNYQEDIIICGKVYIDETYIKVRKRDIKRKVDNKQYRGLSVNQICIGIGYDGTNVIASIEGLGKTSKKKTAACFMNHIKAGSKLIHDQEKAHDVLVKELNLYSEVHNANDLKGLPDKDNPLTPINEQCYLLKHFLRVHSCFIKEDLQDYLNLYSFIMNSATNSYEKIEILLNRALQIPKTLTFREKYSIT